MNYRAACPGTPYNTARWLLRINRACASRYLVMRWDHRWMTGCAGGLHSPFCWHVTRNEGAFCGECAFFSFYIFGGYRHIQLSNHNTLGFCLSSGIQFQFLQASCGVQSSARGLQAPAESAHRWKPNMAWWTWTENRGRQDGEAAAAAGHGGPAGTSHHIHSKSSSLHCLWLVRFCAPVGWTGELVWVSADINKLGWLWAHTGTI